MDYERFDDLAREMAKGVSRRQALKLMGGGLLALVGSGLIQPGVAAAGTREAPDHRTFTPFTPPANPPDFCPHVAHQAVCNGACCAANGTCETRGHSRGMSCAHGNCCSVGQSCCDSRDERGLVSEMCCQADQTCVRTAGPGASYTGACQTIAPLI